MTAKKENPQRVRSPEAIARFKATMQAKKEGRPLPPPPPKEPPTEAQKQRRLELQRKRRAAAKQASGGSSGKGWTPERRAAQSRSMKRKYRTGWHPTKGKKQTRHWENRGFSKMTQAQKRRIWRERSKLQRAAKKAARKSGSGGDHRSATFRKKQAAKSSPGGARPGAGRPRKVEHLNGSFTLRANKPPKHAQPVVHVLEADGALHAYVLTNVWAYVRQP